MLSPLRRNRLPFILLIVFAVVFQRKILADQVSLPHNPGDQYGLFRFAIPFYYHNATLGPDTFDWLVRVYGRSSVIRSNIRRAPSDSHVCGNGGWCRLQCRQFEDTDWKRKHICGPYNCCQPKETTYSPEPTSERSSL